MKSELTRRRFLQAAPVAAAAATVLGASRSVDAATRARAIGANDRIRIGQIGCGGRGVGAHMGGIAPHKEAMNFEIVAVCDPWRVARETAAAKAKEMCGVEPRCSRATATCSPSRASTP